MKIPTQICEEYETWKHDLAKIKKIIICKWNSKWCHRLLANTKIETRQRSDITNWWNLLRSFTSFNLFRKFPSEVKTMSMITTNNTAKRLFVPRSIHIITIFVVLQDAMNLKSRSLKRYIYGHLLSLDTKFQLLNSI